MSSGVPPAASMSRRTFSNICRHCASRSAGTAPLAGSAPEIAPETTNGPFRLAAGIGLRCLTPETSMLRRLSTSRLLCPVGERDDREPAAARQQTDALFDGDLADHSGPIVVGADQPVLPGLPRH